MTILPPEYSPYTQQRVIGTNTGLIGQRVYIGPTDPISDVPVIVAFEHHQLHEGETYQYTYAPAALAINTSVLLRLVVPVLTPTVKTPHFALEVDATAETWVFMYETPTTTANGTQQTTHNRNRNSANAAGMTVWLTPTVTGNGTLLNSSIVGAGTKAGGSSRESIEWDLSSNKVYLIVATAKVAGVNICLRAMWYEDLGV